MNANERELSHASATIDVAIIIVSYNVRDLLRRCLQSIRDSLAESSLRCAIIVVDNDSQDGSASMVAAEFPDVRLIALDQNVGFAGGNNVGLRLVPGVTEHGDTETRRHGDTETKEQENKGTSEQSRIQIPKSKIQNPRYVLLLNPDTEIVGDAIERMARYLDDHPAVAMAGPQLRYGDDSWQSSRRRWPTIGTLFWESTLLEQWWPRNPWGRRYRYGDQPARESSAVDWLVGAALMVRRTAIERAGLLDEGFFMYSEEMEWQARLATYGRIIYLPEAIIRHHEGKSSEQNLARRHINFNRSKLRYAWMRWGRAVARTLRLFLLITYVIQLLIEAAKWLLGHKRPLRRARIEQYGAILRSGL
jgi:N-acetylglucosaminyl-diphospho-decaprenol L-rhamnosyltransferase